MISVDIFSFRKSVYADLEKFTDKFNAAVSGATVFGYNKITSYTPKRTGRARGSWAVGMNRRRYVDLPKVPRTAVGHYPDPPSPQVKFDIRKHYAVWISNRVEYIDFLEKGSHNYGPYAMVARATPSIRKSLSGRLARIK